MNITRRNLLIRVATALSVFLRPGYQFIRVSVSDLATGIEISHGWMWALRDDLKILPRALDLTKN